MVKKKTTKRVTRKKVSPKNVSPKKTANRRKSVQGKVISLKLRSAESMQLDAKKLGNALGKVTALFVLIVSVLAMSGKAVGWISFVYAIYGPLGYIPGLFWKGVVWGTVLGYAKGFVVGWLIAKIYNKSSGCCSSRKK